MASAECTLTHSSCVWCVCRYKKEHLELELGDLEEALGKEEESKGALQDQVGLRLANLRWSLCVWCVATPHTPIDVAQLPGLCSSYGS